MIRTFEHFAAECQRRGLQARSHNYGEHWQIRGGDFLVNFFPSTRRIHVNGTKRGFFGSPEDAIEQAWTIPDIAPPERRDTRGNQQRYKRFKNRKWTPATVCHWCARPMPRANVTVDHVIPLGRGGIDIESNWVLACAGCNHGRSCNMPEVERKQRERRDVEELACSGMRFE